MGKLRPKAEQGILLKGKVPAAFKSHTLLNKIRSGVFKTNTPQEDTETDNKAQRLNAEPKVRIKRVESGERRRKAMVHPDCSKAQANCLLPILLLLLTSPTSSLPRQGTSSSALKVNLATQD